MKSFCRVQLSYLIVYGKAVQLIVSGFDGSNARQVLVSPEEWQGRKSAG